MRSNMSRGKMFTSSRSVRRASYLPDDAIQNPQAAMTHVQPNTEAETGWFVTPASAPDQDEDPWQAPFTAQPKDWLWEDQARQGAPPEDMPVEKPKRLSFFWAGLSAVSLLSIFLSLYTVFKAYQSYPAFTAKASAMGEEVFFDGISIDGTAVGGMTRQQVLMQSLQRAEAANPRVNINLQVDDASYRITENEVPFQRNVSSVLDEAYSIGRQGFPWGVGSSMTPFEIRWQHTRQTARDKAYFSTRVSYDQSSVRSLAESIAAQVNRQPINAVIQEFNFSTKEFKVTQDVPGRQLSGNDVANALILALDSGRYDGIIPLRSTPVLPRVSSVDLQNSFTRLASFGTKTTADEDRNNNIALAAQAISGKTIMPGEVFSFNDTTGQRTIEKGYRGAPAILGGVLIDDVGGGVCQVSSTLFNTAALAGMDIISRSPHAWPVSYLEKGLDAAVNWPNLDFKFRNGKDTPVFLIASYSKRTVTIEIYGMLSSPGEEIMLETQLVSTSQPPPEPLLQPNPSLPPNSTRELKQARVGYVTDTIRVYRRNGVEYRREKLFTSSYSMVQQVIEYN